MPSQLTDCNGPSLQDSASQLPENLPHGLIIPPDDVRQLVEKERSKHSPEAFAKAAERLLNEWTVAHYFDLLNHEVLYRATSRGPEVLAVGLEEVLALKKTLPLEEQRQLKTFLGY